MKRVETGAAGAAPHFIGSWMLDPPSLCRDIIDFFEANPALQRAGATAGGTNTEVKKSTDIIMHPAAITTPGHESFAAYFDGLFSCYTDYLAQWPFVETILPRIEIGSFNIQRYRPGDHFQRVHTERAALSGLHRVFAWMTYLNDVEDGGATYFPHYDLSIQPAAGKTLIWPAEWTHAHAGEVLNAGVKYIVTGWMHFPFSPDDTRPETSTDDTRPET
jgi:prolyl 4-hydroxylase